MKYLFLFLSVVMLGACGKNKSNSIEREDLFSLDIGPMEDQIALYQFEGDMGAPLAGFTMRDGLFYIADGNSGKIVRYNSYGDLLFLIYNDETNPAPLSLITNIEEGERATRWAFSYPLKQPGKIAVDSGKRIYVEDKLPAQSHRFDAESKALLDGIILRFDQNGRFIDYLGREGIGGSPFSRIVGLTASIRDELAVICRVPSGWNAYWYGPSGALLYMVKIDSSAIPSPQDRAVSLSSVDRIAAALDSRRLYIKADYYRDIFDQSTNTRTGSEPGSSIIWILNVEDGTYSGAVEIPLYELTENGRSSEIKMIYSLLGVMRGGKVLLYFPVDAGYSILFLDTRTREQRRGYIQFSNNEIRFSDFNLSPDGIISAMLVDDFRVKMAWWRTDKIIGEAR